MRLHPLVKWDRTRPRRGGVAAVGVAVAAILIASWVIFVATRPDDEERLLVPKKPVIYLYPVQRTEVRVRLDFDGVVTRTDPQIDVTDGWRVMADPSGALTDLASGRSYPYLFWEGRCLMRVDMSSGFVVRGSEVRGFLRDKLAALGLSASEARDFMAYWVPLLETHAFDLIHFESAAYERAARLEVTPRPDTMIRVFMVYEPLAAPVAVTPQQFSRPPSRRGFVLVEWGGGEYPGR
jgi:hypothetical protein